MPLAPPPPPPLVDVAYDGGPGRLRPRPTLVLAAAATGVAAGWLCTLGAVPAILGLLVAKHVLVAILLMGLGVDARGSRAS